MDVIVGKRTEEVDASAARARAAPYAGVLVDIGTGSGRFVYEAARRLPHLLCIGIDAVSTKLQDYSAKALRKAARGGVPNAMFVRSGAEDLPAELAGLATHITVNLPWGSLLRGLVVPDARLISTLRGIASAEATVEILLTYSRSYEPEMIESLGLPELTVEYLEQHAGPLYERQGIGIQGVRVYGNAVVRRLPLEWGRKLAYGRERQFFHILGRVGAKPRAEETPAESLLLSLAR